MKKIETQLKQGYVYEDTADDEDTAEDSKEAQEHMGDWQKKRKKRTKEDVEREALLMGDLYAILGLDDLKALSKEKDIKGAYRQLALDHHPDKLGEELSEAQKQTWLSIQNAYETLLDPAKKRRYDSSLPFDDSIPTEKDINDANFFEVFSQVFKRNTFFSKKGNGPQLGDYTTYIDDVYKFYKFWNYFESWREFSQYDEYDPNDASDRYERRYMEKENKKLRDKHVKKERLRI